MFRGTRGPRQAMALVATTGVGNTCRSEDRRYEGDNKMKREENEGRENPGRPESLLGPPRPRRVVPGSPQFPSWQQVLRGRTGLGTAHSTPLLKTFAAIDGTPLGGFEGNCCFFSALRANGFGFDSLNADRTCAVALSAACFAGFAPFGLVLKALIGEKHLLAGSKNKLGAAFRAFQDLIVVFHRAAPPCWERTGSEQLTPDVGRGEAASAAIPAFRPARTA